MISKKQLEGQLPDYVFDRLSDTEKAVFESEINNHPDLLNEINEVRRVFSQVDKMDFEKIINDKTRNTIVKVNKRLSNQSSKSGMSLLLRYAIPVAVSIAVLIFITNSTKNTDTNKEFSNKLNTIIKTNDLNNYEIDETDYITSYTIDFNQGNGVDNVDVINSIIEDSNPAGKRAVLRIVPYNYVANENIIFEQIQELDEEEFQFLLEEIKNAEI
ncbi:hypothetical protein MASR1M45_30700 [Candidatus Kapaibacterium sp.]